MAYDVTEEIFYGQVLEFSRKTIVRYMENRSLCGFIGTYREYLHRSQAATETFQLRVYSEPDVAARKMFIVQRKESIGAKRRKLEESDTVSSNNIWNFDNFVVNTLLE